MLKITQADSDGQRTLILEGKLISPWLAELEKFWDEVRRASGPRMVVVDLKDVTVISEGGEQLLFRIDRKSVV